MDLVSIDENEITISLFASEAAKLARALTQAACDNDGSAGGMTIFESDAMIACLQAASLAGNVMHPKEAREPWLERVQHGCADGRDCPEHWIEDESSSVIEEAQENISTMLTKMVNVGLTPWAWRRIERAMEREWRDVEIEGRSKLRLSADG